MLNSQSFNTNSKAVNKVQLGTNTTVMVSNSLTKKFLDYWNPSAAIFVESEIWPNMLINVQKNSIPSILLNARITKKSFKKWKIISLFVKFLFEKFDLCLPQNYETK